MLLDFPDMALPPRSMIGMINELVITIIASGHISLLPGNLLDSNKEDVF
jgi:hypothetical protein